MKVTTLSKILNDTLVRVDVLLTCFSMRCLTEQQTLLIQNNRASSASKGNSRDALNVANLNKYKKKVTCYGPNIIYMGLTMDPCGILCDIQKYRMHIGWRS